MRFNFFHTSPLYIGIQTGLTIPLDIADSQTNTAPFKVVFGNKITFAVHRIMYEVAPAY